MTFSSDRLSTNELQPVPPRSAADILANVRALAPFLRERSGEIEAARRLTPEVVERMRAAGAFRIAMPKIWGGPELNIIEINEVIEELAKANASAAWCVVIGCDSGFFSALVDDAAARKLYPNLDMVTAGSVTPMRADRVEGGYVIGGTWPFASGITHADVIVAACLIFENGSPRVNNGAPEVRLMLSSAQNFEVLDTWHTTGMRGTGSNDFRAANLFVAEENSFTFHGPAKRDGTLYFDPMCFLAKFYGAPLGMARAMIDHARVTMDTKFDPIAQRRYKDSAAVQIAVAEAEMTLGAARAYAYSTLEKYWSRLEARVKPSQELRIELALARVYAARAAREVIRSLYDAVGASAIYASRGPFDRALRDIETISQHLGVQARVLENVGGLLLKSDRKSIVPYI